MATNEKKQVTSLLTKKLEAANVYYSELPGDGYSVYYGPQVVTFKMVNPRIVEISAPVGVTVTPQNELALRAVANHMHSWKFKVASYRFEGDQVIGYYLRDLSDAHVEDIERMVDRLVYTNKSAHDAMKRVEEGATPSEALAEDKQRIRTMMELFSDHDDDDDEDDGCGMPSSFVDDFLTRLVNASDIETTDDTDE